MANADGRRAANSTDARVFKVAGRLARRKLIACLYSETEPPGELKLAIVPAAGGPPIKVFSHPIRSASTVRWTPNGRGLTYRENPLGASKIWVQPLTGGPPESFAEFETDRVFGFDWSRDGKHLAVVRGFWSMDAVLIKDF